MESLAKFSRSMVVMLVIQFIFGMTVNLFGVPPNEETATNKAPEFARLAFAAHGILGLAILIVGVVILVAAFKSKKDQIKKIGSLGFISVLVAFIAGIMTITREGNAAEISSFVMAVGFICAIVSYGKLFHTLKK